ncbi:MAG: hypothetical protein JNN32_11505 [Flavobacteriales bacterium]|nr:hypothetical protein [Flavobacteriales bacterium]
MTGTHKQNQQNMWPVQTLTLLLCLTDEEQLFAQCVPTEPEPVRIEQVTPQQDEQEEKDTIEFPVA